MQDLTQRRPSDDKDMIPKPLARAMFALALASLGLVAFVCSICMALGVPIGVAAKGVDGSWRVKLFSDRGAIDYVKVLLFEDFGQLVGGAERCDQALDLKDAGWIQFPGHLSVPIPEAPGR